MNKTILFALALAVLSACGASQSSAPPDPAVEAAWGARKAVDYKGNVFEFARHAERPVAYIQATSDDFKYTAADVEAITRAQTGCRAKLDAGVLAALSGFGPDADLSIVSNRGKPLRWSVALSC